MKITKKEYAQLVKKHSPNSKLLKDCFFAFLTGGTICLIGEVLYTFYLSQGFIISDARLLMSITLVGLSALFTSIGWYHKLATKAGAGTLIPITGFANAVVSPALEFKAEGMITGVGAKMFIIAGPVLVYGVLASAVYGAFLYFIMPFLGG